MRNTPVPKLIIATTTEVFREFEKRYADKIPVVSGDFTPYWENGACSTARETAINRTAAERLVQAEALSAMFSPRRYPAEQFTEAWRNVILYDEHTWGAYNSITEPDKPFVKDQWKIKQAFALDADAQSRKLLGGRAGRTPGRPNGRRRGRMEHVGLAADRSGRGRQGTERGRRRRHRAGRQAGPRAAAFHGRIGLLGQEFARAGRPALHDRRRLPLIRFGHAKAEASALSTPAVSVKVDPASGAIVSLRRAGGPELCDMKSGVGLNRYYYVLGTKVKEAQPAGPAKISVKESGPLVASLLIESDAPGCVKLSREIRVVDGLDRVDIINVLDKKAVREKEGVHLGFAFNVPDGVMRMDIPWAVMRPEVDQIAGSCKNWLSVGRWVDVSNRERGVTWATLDAPMVLVGAITADRIGSLPNPNDWLAKLEPSQTLYSMVMNNHWFTNYKADQDGPTTFRYSLLPHKQYDQAAASGSASSGASRWWSPRPGARPPAAGHCSNCSRATCWWPRSSRATTIRPRSCGCSAPPAGRPRSTCVGATTRPSACGSAIWPRRRLPRQRGRWTCRPMD